MPASTDYFTKVGDPGTASTLAAPGHLIGGTSITVVSTANYPTTTGCTFAIDTVTLVNGEEVRDAGSYTEWTGVVTGATTIESMVLRYGTDQNYPAGATTRVYIPVSSSRENRLIDGLLVSHDQDGTLKADAVDNSAAIKDGVVTAAKIETQQAWQAPTLQNNWVNYDDGFTPVQYMKDSLGFVHVRGFLKSGITTVATLVFTLPVGYRPGYASYYCSGVGSGNIINAWEINAAGAFKVIVANGTYSSIGSIIFKAEN
jgi:hypothetical protein